MTPRTPRTLQGRVQLHLLVQGRAAPTAHADAIEPALRRPPRVNLNDPADAAQVQQALELILRTRNANRPTGRS